MEASAIGTVALWGAIAASALAALTSLVPNRRAAGRSLLLVSLALATLAAATLSYALVTGDFGLEYVARTTSRATPLPYRIAALWGGMEGSLLFYATLTLAVGTVATLRLGRDQSVATVVIATVGCGLLALTAVFASPFTTLDIPAVDGQGLLAILQHPAMIYHPPILYLGLTSLVVPFAITVTAVLNRSIDQDWLHLTRRWLLLSWTLLAVGMVAGANWAYIELGWGGFWAWDPVENTALMPWLAATVFLHTSSIQRRDGRLARWNVAFAVSPFVLAALGVYLTRSGATGSIHSFAEDPLVGKVLLTVVVVVAVFASAMAFRTPRGTRGVKPELMARDTWLTGNGVLLGIALLVVAVGSAYPAYVNVFLDSQVSVPPRFFVGALLPIAFLVTMGMAFAFRIRWNATPMPWRRLAAFFLIAAAAMLLALGVFPSVNAAGLPLLGVTVAAMVLLAVDVARVRPSGRILAGHLAHLGIALVLLGGAASSLGAEFSGAMGPGDEVVVGPYTVAVDEIVSGETDRFVFVAADIDLIRDGAVIDRLRPEIRAYGTQGLPIAEPALRSTVTADVIVAIGRVSEDASLVWVSVFLRPLVFWVWMGALLVVAAGLVALFAKDGGAVRPRPAATAAPQQAGRAKGS